MASLLLRKIIQIRNLKKDAFVIENGALLGAHGHPKIKKSAKVPPKGALFTLSEKRLGNHRFLDPPEPFELSWRLHKTSIFTCWPFPQNGTETTSQNLH